MRPSETENEAFHVPRLLNLPALLEKKSYFLFGPRQAGKTSLIRCTLQEARVYDLLNTSVYLTLSQDPARIAQELTARDRIVVINEIQRLPPVRQPRAAEVGSGKYPSSSLHSIPRSSVER